MKLKRKYVFIFCLILVDAFLLIGFLVIRDATSINKLKKEMKELEKLDIMSDRYNREIQTSGKYAVVEESIKDYLDSYALEVQSVNKLIHDPELSKVLSYENYSKDGPEFKNSIAYLEESRETFNDQIDGLLYDLEEKQIKDNIYERTHSKYYVSLYQDMMLDEKITDDLHQSRELFQKTRVKMNNIYDTSLNVLNFLVTYKDSWELKDGEIKFKTEDLCQYYDSLIAQVNTKKDE